VFVFDSEVEAEKPVRNFRTNYVRYPGVTTVNEREIPDVTVPDMGSPYLVSTTYPVSAICSVEGVVAVTKCR
jgi:hypothetical protein